MAVAVAEDVAGPLENADHGKRLPIDLHRPAQRVRRPEQCFREGLREHGHRPGCLDIRWQEIVPRDEGPGRELVPADALARYVHPLDGAAGRALDRRVPIHVHRGRPHVRELVQTGRLRGGHLRVRVPRRPVVAELDLHEVVPGDDEVLRSRGLDPCHRLAPDAGDGGAHGHHGRDADHDAHDGQARPELVGPDLVEGDQHRFPDPLDGPFRSQHAIPPSAPRPDPASRPGTRDRARPRRRPRCP